MILHKLFQAHSLRSFNTLHSYISLYLLEVWTWCGQINSIILCWRATNLISIFYCCGKKMGQVVGSDCILIRKLLEDNRIFATQTIIHPLKIFKYHCTESQLVDVDIFLNSSNLKTFIYAELVHFLSMHASFAFSETRHSIHRWDWVHWLWSLVITCFEVSWNNTMPFISYLTNKQK